MTETPKTTRRCFVAVPLPAAVRDALFDAGARLAPELPGVRWQRKRENLHVTLQFLGDVSDARIEDLIETLPRRLGDIPAFEVGVRGVGAFPSAAHAGVVWAGVADPTGSLAQIAGRIRPEAEPREAGRPFRAHITLGRAVGRAKAGVDARAAVTRWAEADFGLVVVAEVHLYESHLSRSGSTYVVLARAPLGSPPDSTR